MARERLLPQNAEAEQSVIGAILQDVEAMNVAREMLAPEMFLNQAHCKIFAAALACDVVDNVTVTAELKKREELEAVGGDAYLTECILSVPATWHVEHYANIVERTYQLRRLLSLPAQITEAVYSDAPDVDDVFAKIRAAVESVRPQNNDGATLTWDGSIDLALSKQTEREIDAEKSDKEARRLRFPWLALDRIIGRLREGTVTVLAAESSVGKTALAECCAEHWARNGLHIVFVHLEISHQRMVDRRMCRWSGIPMQTIDRGNLTPVQKDSFFDALNRMGGASGNIDYIYAAGWRMSRIVSALERMHSKRPLDAVIVDYLTIIPYEANQFSMNTAQATAHQVGILKTFADQTGIPCLLLSQLNRDASDGLRRANRLRNSGETLERASVVVTFDRAVVPEAEGGDGVRRSNVANVAVEKNTDGDTGGCKLWFNGERLVWVDVQREEF
jgi:replicative DNA helicase